MQNLQGSTQRVVFGQQLCGGAHETGLPGLYESSQALPVRGVGALPEKQHRQRQFSFGQVGSQGLTGGGFGTEQVHAIIKDLVSGAKSQSKLAQRRAMLRCGTAQERAEITRESEQLSGLHLQNFKVLFAGKLKIAF